MKKMYISYLSSDVNKLNEFSKDLNKIIKGLESIKNKTLDNMIDLKMYRADLYRIDREIKRISKV